MLLVGGRILTRSISKKQGILSPLNYACISGYIDAIDVLLRDGDGLWMLWGDHHRRFYCKNALITALEHRSNRGTIAALLKVGGISLVCDEHRSRNSLFYALKYRSSLDIIELLIKTGGRGLITKKDLLGRSRSVAPGIQRITLDIIDSFMRYGGKTMLQRSICVSSIALVADQAVKRMNFMKILRLIDIECETLLSWNNGMKCIIDPAETLEKKYCQSTCANCVIK